MDEKEFRRLAALEVMTKLLEKPTEWFDVFIHPNEHTPKMSIYDFAADIAVEYADALVNRLDK